MRSLISPSRIPPPIHPSMAIFFHKDHANLHKPIIHCINHMECHQKNRCGLVDDVFRSLFDYVWKPKTVEDSIDAGVHPAVAELRRREADKQRTVTEP